MTKRDPILFVSWLETIFIITSFHELYWIIPNRQSCNHSISDNSCRNNDSTGCMRKLVLKAICLIHYYNKSNKFEMTMHSYALFQESRTITSYVTLKLNVWEVDNTVGKVIYLDGVSNPFDTGTNATTMKDYVQQMKYPLEEATKTLQSLQQLGDELKQLPLPIRLFSMWMISRHSWHSKTCWCLEGSNSTCRSQII